LNYPWTFTCLGISLVSMIGCLTCLGCETKGYDDYSYTQEGLQEGLELLSHANYGVASVSFSNNEYVDLDKSEHDMVRPLIKSLVPFQIEKRDDDYNPNFKHNFKIQVHAGSEPVGIYVRVSDEKLRFQINNFVYLGGSSKNFLEQIEKIKAKIQAPPIANAAN